MIASIEAERAAAEKPPPLARRDDPTLPAPTVDRPPRPREMPCSPALPPTAGGDRAAAIPAESPPTANSPPRREPGATRHCTTLHRIEVPIEPIDDPLIERFPRRGRAICYVVSDANRLTLLTIPEHFQHASRAYITGIGGCPELSGGRSRSLQALAARVFGCDSLPPPRSPDRCSRASRWSCPRSISKSRSRSSSVHHHANVGDGPMARTYSARERLSILSHERLGNVRQEASELWVVSIHSGSTSPRPGTGEAKGDRYREAWPTIRLAFYYAPSLASSKSNPRMPTQISAASTKPPQCTSFGCRVSSGLAMVLPA